MYISFFVHVDMTGGEDSPRVSPTIEVTSVRMDYRCIVELIRTDSTEHA